jgi:hypothetical protein
MPGSTKKHRFFSGLTTTQKNLRLPTKDRWVHSSGSSRPKAEHFIANTRKAQLDDVLSIFLLIYNFIAMLKSFEEPSVMEALLQNSKTLDARLEDQLRDKYRTFTRFNYR